MNIHYIQKKTTVYECVPTGDLWATSPRSTSVCVILPFSQQFCCSMQLNLICEVLVLEDTKQLTYNTSKFSFSPILSTLLHHIYEPQKLSQLGCVERH